MQVSQTRLPSQSTGVTPNSMINEIPHTELCQWLKAVAISRDKDAFTHLFRFFAPKIQRITKNKLNTNAQANEVVQETMSNVWRKAHLFNEDKGFSLMPIKLKSTLTLPSLLLAFSSFTYASDNVENTKTDKIYSPFVVGENATQVYWGDTHLHTSYSADAGMVGNKIGLEDAYRFALGHEINTSSGQRARLIRPLDFLVISDHAENLGLSPLIANSDPELLKTEYGKKLHDLVKEGKGHEAFLLWIKEGMSKNIDLIDNPVMGKSVWASSVDMAEKYNDPGRFTAFVAFEWTSINTPQVPSNLHRVVLFKDGADKAKQVMPYTMFESYDPEDLWTYMESYEEKTIFRPAPVKLNHTYKFNIDQKIKKGSLVMVPFGKKKDQIGLVYEIIDVLPTEIEKLHIRKCLNKSTNLPMF